MKKLFFLAGLAMAAGASPAMATVVFNSSVTQWSSTDPTPGAVGGNGQVNGGFAVDTTPVGGSPNASSLELALRASHYGNGMNGVTVLNNQYFVQPGYADSPTNSRFWWSFDFDINAVGTGLKMSDLDLTLEIDTDPTAGQSWTDLRIDDPEFVPIPFPPGLLTEYTSANYNPANLLFQDSFNAAFFPLGIDPSVSGQYDIRLSATGASIDPQQLTISVIVGNGAPVVPEPATLSLMAIGLAATALRRRRTVSAK